MKKTSSKSQRRTINTIFIVFCCFFLSVFCRFAYIVYAGDISGVNIKQFSQKRNQKIEILNANRGLIMDSNRSLIAQNIASFTVVAVLSENQVDEKGQPAYVQDKEKTAKELANILKAPEAFVVEQLNKKGVYQVEFGKYGKDISFEQKAQLENLKLPGINFEQGIKRNYPNGIFAANVVGFTNYDDNENKVIGKQGLEWIYETELSGRNGKKVYAANAQGQPIDASTVEELQKHDGMNIETTIDGTMQRYVEQTLQDITKESGAENSFAILMNPKNGKILAMAQTPTFDPNVKEKVNSNIFTERVYEVGSVMKPITIAAAIEDNRFNENTRFKSGSYKIDDVTIFDYDKKGWGELAYKDILCHSANTGISDLLLTQYSPDLFRSKLDEFGFFKPADPMKNIFNGKASTTTVGSTVFKTNIEKVTTGFGQGTTSTLLQLLRSYTAIANDGTMIEPHLINKIINPNTGEETFYKPATSNPISTQTAQKVRTLLVPVTETKGCTSTSYKMKDIVTAGKSGTSQIIGENGKYLEGDTNTLASFIGMVPAQKPELILYTGVMKSKNDTPTTYNQKLYTRIMSNALNYYAINQKESTKPDSSTTEMPQYVGEKTERIRAEISQKQQKIVIIGNGENIVYQNIKVGTALTGSTIFLITDGNEFMMPNIIGWSKKDVQTLREYFHLQGENQGVGFAQTQSIKKGVKLQENDILNVTYK